MSLTKNVLTAILLTLTCSAALAEDLSDMKVTYIYGSAVPEDPCARAWATWAQQCIQLICKDTYHGCYFTAKRLDASRVELSLTNIKIKNHYFTFSAQLPDPAKCDLNNLALTQSSSLLPIGEKDTFKTKDNTVRACNVNTHPSSAPINLPKEDPAVVATIQELKAFLQSKEPGNGAIDSRVDYLQAKASSSRKYFIELMTSFYGISKGQAAKYADALIADLQYKQAAGQAASGVPPLH